MGVILSHIAQLGRCVHLKFLRKQRAAAKAAIGLLWVCLCLPALAQEDHATTPEQSQAGYRIYADQCQLCHGPNGDGIAGTNLARQQFRLVSSDADIRRMIAGGNVNGMPPFPALKPDEIDDLVAFIRSGMVQQNGGEIRPGDAARGKAIYDGKGGCAACHSIAGQGAHTGPDLTDIGNVRRPAQIANSLTDPGKATMPINRPVVITLKNGRVIKGRRYDEDTYAARLIDERENLVSVSKADMKSYVIRRDTDMPSFKGKLTDGELGDLMAYLISLKG